MKPLFISFLALVVVLSSCVSETIIGPEGPKGDTGPQGPAGAPGESGYVFEYENINFTSGDNYSVLLEYPDDFEGLESDVALVYLLWPLEDGLDYDVWRPLSQQVLFTDGTLQYNYDFTAFDTRLFLEANFPLDELAAIDTDNWVARVVIVPGSFWASSGRTLMPEYACCKDGAHADDQHKD